MRCEKRAEDCQELAGKYIAARHEKFTIDFQELIGKYITVRCEFTITLTFTSNSTILITVFTITSTYLLCRAIVLKNFIHGRALGRLFHLLP